MKAKWYELWDIGEKKAKNEGSGIEDDSDVIWMLICSVIRKGFKRV